MKYLRKKDKRMKNNLMFIILMAFLLTFSMGMQSAEAYSGVVSVDTVEAEAGQQVAVPIRIHNNDEPISAITIPLWVTNPDITIDSISFEGSILPSNFTGLIQPDTAIGDTVKISLIGNWASPTPTITTYEGILATLFVTISPSAMPGTVAIDSFYIIDTIGITDNGTPIEAEQKLLASDITGLVLFYPGFTPGAVVVLSPTDADDDFGKTGLPTDYSLGQNYPNPFNPTTTIEFALPSAGAVKLEVFNVLGQQVVTLVDGYLSAGTHLVTFDASNEPSGVYFYRLSHSNGIETKKMTLLK